MSSNVAFRKGGRCFICIICYKPAGVHITRRILKKCFTSNSDGAGFMWAANDILYWSKGYFTFRKFYKSFRDYEKQYPKSNFAIHCRIATSGFIDTEGCHPFIINDSIGFMHNGILWSLGNKSKSDTQEFVETVLDKLPNSFMSNEFIIKTLDDYAIASGSKFLLMNNKGQVVICNEKMGEWDNDIWYSNMGYKSYSTYGGYSKCDWHEDYTTLSTDYKKCWICAGWKPVDTMKRVNNNSSHFICESCLAGFSSPRICTCCGAEVPRNQLRAYKAGGYMCDICFSSFSLHVGVDCPVCSTKGCKLVDEKCWYCGYIFTDDDVDSILQLSEAQW